MASAVSGVTEQVPVPLGHPASAAVCHLAMRLLPVPSLTHRRYQVEVETAFQLYVGVLAVIVPEGHTSVA